MTRLYFAGYTGFVSAVFGSAGAFGSGSPTAGLFLPEKGKELLCRGAALDAPLLCGIHRICVRDFGQCHFFCSDSPSVGLFLPEKGKELLRRGAALSAPLPCGIRQVCVRGFWQCRGFWLGLSYRWPVLERKKAENFYVAGRRLARLYFAGYGGFVSAVFGSAGAFGSGSPPAGLFLKERRQRTFTSRGGA